MSCLGEERVALVTGGSRGIGAAVVKELATHGYKTAVNYKERLQEAEALVAGIVEEGGRSIVVGADIPGPRSSGADGRYRAGGFR